MNQYLCKYIKAEIPILYRINRCNYTSIVYLAISSYRLNLKL